MSSSVSGDHATLELPTGGVPLGFVREEDRVHLVAREPSARWPVAVLRAGRARLRVGGSVLEGGCSLRAPGPERERILELFRRKYGEADFARWYAHPYRVLTVDPEADGPAGGDPERYYGWLESEFDNIAAEYDRHILENRMNRLLRSRSLALLGPTFRDAPRLLEIGCGSGLETLTLLEQGHEITAVDISPAMLGVVREKARRAGLSERLTTVHARAGAVPLGPSGVPEGVFDGGYSTYGAMNCEPDLAPIRDAFARALRPGARLVLGVYNRWCASELFGYGITLRWARAFGRRGWPIRVGASRFCVDVYAFTPGEIERQFAPQFSRRTVSAVPILLPPSDLTLYAEKFSRRFDRLDRWDAWLGRRAALAGFGDHFLMTLDRTPGGPRP